MANLGTPVLKRPSVERAPARAARAALVGLAACLWLSPAQAQKPRGKGAAPRAAAAAEKPAPAQAQAAQGQRSEAGAAVPPASSAREKGIQGQSKAAAGGPAPVVATEEGKEGVKTYKFGAVEVEGRLRSPQLIYFLRRVRAEFLAGDLGHRSFLPELSATARKPTFR
jgi:hypothetical protein